MGPKVKKIYVQNCSWNPWENHEQIVEMIWNDTKWLTPASTLRGKNDEETRCSASQPGAAWAWAIGIQKLPLTAWHWARWATRHSPGCQMVLNVINHKRNLTMTHHVFSLKKLDPHGSTISTGIQEDMPLQSEEYWGLCFSAAAAARALLGALLVPPSNWWTWTRRQKNATSAAACRRELAGTAS